MLTPAGPGERRKQRLALLDQLLDQTALPPAPVSSSAGVSEAAPFSQVDLLQDEWLDASMEAVVPSIGLGSELSSSSSSVAGLTASDAEIPCLAYIPETPISIPETVDSSSWAIVPTSPHGSTSTIPSASAAAEGVADSSPPRSTRLEPAVVQTLRSFGALSPAERRQLLAVINESSAQRHDQGANSAGTTAQFSDFRGLESWIIERIQADARLADLNVTISLNQCAFVAAALQNAMACGLLQNNLLWDEDAVSPFSAGAVAATGLEQARQQFASVTKDLRPADGQILVPHHPYIVGVSARQASDY